MPKKRGGSQGGNAAFFPVKSDTTFHWVLTSEEKGYTHHILIENKRNFDGESCSGVEYYTNTSTSASDTPSSNNISYSFDRNLNLKNLLKEDVGSPMIVCFLFAFIKIKICSFLNFETFCI